MYSKFERIDREAGRAAPRHARHAQTRDLGLPLAAAACWHARTGRSYRERPAARPGPR